MLLGRSGLLFGGLGLLLDRSSGLLGGSWVDLGGSWGGLGSVLGALGFSWLVLGAREPDPKAILAIPGGQGGRLVGLGKRYKGVGQ